MASTNDAPPEQGDGPSLSLAQQINASIASTHTTLNRLILERMPRAVPPQTDNPSTYITGLLHIGAVYIAFESLWQNLLGIHSEIAPIPYAFPLRSPDQHSQQQQHQQHNNDTPRITARTRRVLEQAYHPAMLRAPRIKADVQAMTGWPDHVFEQQLRAAGTSAHLGRFTLHIRDAVSAKPHLLLAYAYTLYLALLSGGSYIRTELMYLKRDFWEATPAPVVPGLVACTPDTGRLRWPRAKAESQDDEDEDRDGDHDDVDDDDDDSDAGSRRLPLDFLDFDPPLGANPRQQTKLLKADFKTRFAAADALLADPERRDIIAEASLIFQHLEGVVAQLDQLFDAPSAPVKTPAVRALGSTGVRLRLRDSIAIAKGRLLRSRRKSSGSSAVAAAAMAPGVVAEELEAADTLGLGSTRPSSVSAASSGTSAVPVSAGDEQASGGSEPGDVARHAVVPHEGFRTIRYDSDMAGPDSAAATSATPGGGGGGRRRRHHEGGKDAATRHGFDGASDYCCPMSRAPGLKSAGPDYALYAIVSNLVLLGAVVGVFIAWLWMRHGEGADVWAK